MQVMAQVMNVIVSRLNLPVKSNVMVRDSSLIKRAFSTRFFLELQIVRKNFWQGNRRRRNALAGTATYGSHASVFARGDPRNLR